jgi:F-type H+-transporting ATPase subunit epsilon
MPALNISVVTPETTLLDESAEFVAVPLYDGELGIAPDHSPMIGRLGFGELRIRQGGQSRSFYIDGGFVQVADNNVAVLTNRAVPSSDLSATVAAEQLAAARHRAAHTPELRAIRDRLELQARAQLRIARRAQD